MMHNARQSCDPIGLRHTSGWASRCKAWTASMMRVPRTCALSSSTAPMGPLKPLSTKSVCAWRLRCGGSEERKLLAGGKFDGMQIEARIRPDVEFAAEHKVKGEQALKSAQFGEAEKNYDQTLKGMERGCKTADLLRLICHPYSTVSMRSGPRSG